MSKTHWKKMVNMDYLGTYSLDDGQDLTLTIDYVRQEVVTGNSGRKEQCMVAHFKENVKPMILNRTNAKTITKVTSSPYIEDWNGKKITLYADTTRFGGDIVECLRIRPYAPVVQRNTKQTVPEQPSDLICENCGKPITAAYGKSAEGVAELTTAKYGKRLCAACAKEANASV